jgi:hypothetical protein
LKYVFLCGQEVIRMLQVLEVSGSSPVKMKINLRAENIRLNLLSISKDPKLHKHNAFIFMIISHGNQNGEIFGFDGKPLKIGSLIYLFNEKECKQLDNNSYVFLQLLRRFVFIILIITKIIVFHSIYDYDMLSVINIT